MNVMNIYFCIEKGDIKSERFYKGETPLLRRSREGDHPSLTHTGVRSTLCWVRDNGVGAVAGSYMRSACHCFGLQGVVATPSSVCSRFHANPWKDLVGQGKVPRRLSLSVFDDMLSFVLISGGFGCFGFCGDGKELL